MADFRFIIRDDVPCWYEFSYQNGDTPRLKIRIHEEFLHNDPLPADAPIFNTFDQDFKFPPMRSEFGQDWGFGGCLKFAGKTGSFFEYMFEVPKIRIEDGKCKHCDGTGDGELDTRCFYCNGKRVEHKYLWDEIYEISGSLAILLEYLSVIQFDTSSKHPQLMTVRTMLRQGMHGGSLGGDYSRVLVSWLAAQGFPRKIPVMEQAMKEVWGRMMGQDQVVLDRHRFQAHIDHKDGWLNISCPGNACGLNPNHTGPRPGQGYEFSCHNVDSAAQQLTLLASLAALHDLVRSELG